MNTQLPLPRFGPAADDGFRFTWWDTRIGAACWVEHRGAGGGGVIVHRGRKYVMAMLTDGEGRTRYVRRGYGELRRRVVKPRLVMLRRVAKANSELRRVR